MARQSLRRSVHEMTAKKQVRGSVASRVTANFDCESTRTTINPLASNNVDVEMSNTQRDG